MVLNKTIEGEEVYQVSEKEWHLAVEIGARTGNGNFLEQVCDPPKRKHGNPRRMPQFDLTKIAWDSNYLYRKLCGFNTMRLHQICSAIDALKSSKGNWKIFRKKRLIDYLLEEVYDLGWTTEEVEETIKDNEDSKKSKQTDGKKTSQRKRPVGRPKKQLAKKN